LSVANHGRAVAHFIHLAVRPLGDYRIDQYGIDGNTNEGLTRLFSKEPGTVRDGSTPLVVVHPNTTMDVCAVQVSIDVESRNRRSSPVSSLAVNYELAAEGFPLATGQLTIGPSELMGGILPRSVYNRTED